MESAVCVTSEANQNLTPSHKEPPQWNFRLGHIGFQHVQQLICTGRLKVQGNPKEVDKRERPKCDACDFVKLHCQHNKVNLIKNNTMKEQEPKKDHIFPRHMVPEDHYISRDPGRLYHTKGKSYLSEMF